MDDFDYGTIDAPQFADLTATDEVDNSLEWFNRRGESNFSLSFFYHTAKIATVPNDAASTSNKENETSVTLFGASASTEKESVSPKVGG